MLSLTFNHYCEAVDVELGSISYLRVTFEINLCSVMGTTRLWNAVTTVTGEHLVIGIFSFVIDVQTGPQTPREIVRALDCGS